MLAQFKADYNNLTTRQFNARYIAPVIVFVCLVLLAGQIAYHYCTVRQLNKTTGILVNMNTHLAGYTHHRVGATTANYTMTLILDNSQTFDIKYVPLQKRLDTVLHVNDVLTVYSPNHLLTVLTAGTVAHVAQLQSSKRMLYSFDEEKNRAWVLIYLLLMAAGVFTVFILVCRKQD